MTAERLHRMLVDADLPVRQYQGWETRGYDWARRKPVGSMVHHTARPVPYPVARLAGSLIKCNWNTKPDGTLWLVAYGACNYSSGSGSSVVLDEVLAGIAPRANAKTRGLEDDYNGNPWFWNGEHDHWGHGEPMPAVQSRTITVGLQVFNAYFGHTAGQTISHAEHSPRKTDPYWDGDRRVIETIRDSLEDDMLTDEQARQLADLHEAFFNKDRSILYFLRKIFAHQPGGPNLPSFWNTAHRTYNGTIELLAEDLVNEADLDDAVERLVARIPVEMRDLLYRALAPGPR